MNRRELRKREFALRQWGKRKKRTPMNFDRKADKEEGGYHKARTARRAKSMLKQGTWRGGLPKS